MKKQQTGRIYILIRNILLIILALIVWWLIMGTPALTRNQAFRRAMREHFLDPKNAEVFFGEDGRISALAKADDPVFNVYVQTGVRRSGIFWYHGLWSETEMTNDPATAGYYSTLPEENGQGSAYIIPLFAYGHMIDSPEVAVLPVGLDPKQIHTAELVFVFEGEQHRLELMGEQDGWFLFHFEQDVWRAPETEYKNFIRNMEYKKLGTPEGRTGCSFGFTAYDQNGRQVMNVIKKY
ncbi:MAG: hypothetical protein ILP14_05810 [Oscillospiraceae bacterium]|nr:hypothetical protein [Oscillospiraceae bacterium]